MGKGYCNILKQVTMDVHVPRIMVITMLIVQYIAKVDLIVLMSRYYHVSVL